MKKAPLTSKSASARSTRAPSATPGSKAATKSTGKVPAVTPPSEPGTSVFAPAAAAVGVPAPSSPPTLGGGLLGLEVSEQDAAAVLAQRLEEAANAYLGFGPVKLPPQVVNAFASDELRGALAELDATFPELSAAVEQYGPGLLELGQRVVDASGELDLGQAAQELFGEQYGPAVDLLQRLLKLRRDLQGIDFGFAQFSQAFTDVSGTEEAKQARRDAVHGLLGEPLADAVVAILSSVAQAVPDEALTQVDQQFRASTRGQDGELTDKLNAQWWSPFFPKDLGFLPQLKAAIAKPEFRDAVVRGLAIVGAGVSVEMDRIENVALEFPPEARPKVREALVRYLTDTTVPVAQELVGTTVEPGSPTAAFVQALAQLVVVAKSDRPLAENAELLFPALKALDQVSQDPEALLSGFRAPDPTVLDQRLDARKVGDDIDRLTARMLQGLEDNGVTVPPEARQAILGLNKDLRSAAMMALSMVKMVGAMMNPNIPDENRSDEIKNSAELMGPLAIKALQTVANQQALIRQFIDSGDDKSVAIIVETLKKLQDRVTPMPDEQVQTILKANLGEKYALLEDFDPKPLASASIGQVHRAFLRLGPNERVEVAVKVMRPGLAEEFDSSERVIRLGLAMAKEWAKNADFLPDALTPEKLDAWTRWVEANISRIIDSFRTELDFDAERRNLQQFRRDLGADPFVAVPEVYPSVSTKEVLVQQFVHGEKIEDMVERLASAEAWRKEGLVGVPFEQRQKQDFAQRAQAWATFHLGQTPTSVDARLADGGHLVRLGFAGGESTEVKVDWEGRVQKPLGAGLDARREAESRARAWAKLNFGLDPTKVTAWFADDGYRVELNLGSSLFAPFDVHVHWDGRITTRERVPPLTQNSLRDVRDRLVATFLTELVVTGRVHGDLHQGNFFVLPDGKTLVLIDLGNVIQMERSHLAGPIQLVIGWLRKDPKAMAEAFAKMAQDQRAQLTLSDEQKESLRVRFAAALAAKNPDAPEGQYPVGLTGEELLAVLPTVGMEVGVTLSSVYFQGLKTVVAMTGNYVALSGLDDESLGLKDALRATRATGTSMAEAATRKANPAVPLIQAQKKRRVRDAGQ